MLFKEIPVCTEHHKRPINAKNEQLLTLKAVGSCIVFICSLLYDDFPVINTI